MLNLFETGFGEEDENVNSLQHRRQLQGDDNKRTTKVKFKQAFGLCDAECVSEQRLICKWCLIFLIAQL